MKDRWIVIAVVCVVLLIGGSAFALTLASDSGKPKGSFQISDAVPILYVTFSGESDKSGVTDPVRTVWGLTANGQVNNNVIPGTAAFDELRGMTLTPAGKFFLVQANKSRSTIFTYEQKSNGQLVNQQIFTDQALSPSLVHPYAVESDAASNLFVSVQDTFAVSQYGPTGQPAPISQYLRKTFPTFNFYPGTFAASSLVSLEPLPAPAPIPASSGGLTDPRGILVSQANQRLYVADDTSNRVLSYNLTSGAYLGSVFTDPKARPVDLAMDPISQALYVTAETTNAVYTVDVTNCDNNCSSSELIPSKIDGVKLDAPAGIAVVPLGNQSQVFVASRHGQAVNKYVISNGQVVNSSVFVSGLPDTPEQIIVATR